MKFLLMTALIALPLLSEARDDLDGCEVTSEETMIATTTRGTTNAFVPPTFGMSSGTIGCKKISLAAVEQESADFVVSNFVNLKQELAMGNGEYVDGLFEVMECGQAANIKANYETVVAPTTNGIELYKNLKSFCI